MKHLAPYQVGILTFIVAIIFSYWLLSVVAPMIMLEASYQYKKILRDEFGVSDIRGLILPQFHFDFKGTTSKYTVNGITIPTIFVDEPVIYNVDPNNSAAYLPALKLGIAHASSTAFPGLPAQAGSGGLGYYFAHSSTPNLVQKYNAVFYLLEKLHVGDDVYMWHEGSRFDYTVTDSNITSPDDLSFLHQVYTTETIVLQTCWPPGTTLQRLLVFARRSNQ